MSICFWPEIQTVDAENTPAVIVRDSQWTIVLAHITSQFSNENNVILPSDCEIGDVVEIHSDHANFNLAVNIYAPSGDTIEGGSPLTSPQLLRKLNATFWGASR